MGRTHVFKCRICGRDIEVSLPLLILVVVEFLGRHIPTKALFTGMAKCKTCSEMRGYDETQIDEDTEELTVDDFNALVQSGVPVMKQIVHPEGEPDKEEGEEPKKKVRRKIGFRVENEEDE